MIHGLKPIVLLVALLTSLLSACAEVTVTKVSGDDDQTVGVRYYLPKPFIIFAPQADGTVSASVVYLPDTTREYAINATSSLSSYAFQASTDQSGLLTAVQYNTDTTAVGAQTAASVGSGIAAGFNYQTAQAAARQTQVNTAQAGVIAAQSAYASALAQLSSDNQANQAGNTVSASALQVDASTVAQKLAALQVAQAALQAAQSTPQAVAGAAAAGTPITSTPAAAGTALAGPAWSQGPVINLPQPYGPVWFAVNDYGGADVCLRAVRSRYPSRTPGDAKPDKPGTPTDAKPAGNLTDAKPAGNLTDAKQAGDPKAGGAAQVAHCKTPGSDTEKSGPDAVKSGPDTEKSEAGTEFQPDAQPTFQSTLRALGPPQIPVPTAPFSKASKVPAVFMFNRTVTRVRPHLYALDRGLTEVIDPKPLWDGDQTVTVDISPLRPGAYQLSMEFDWRIDPLHEDVTRMSSQKFNFNVTEK